MFLKWNGNTRITGMGDLFIKNKLCLHKKLNLSIIFLVLFVTSSFATTYYVSPSGNDSNSGTSPSEAWRTLDKVSSFSPKPGDQILFQKGGKWVGTIQVNASGTSGNPIIYGAYGTGEKPTIYGSQLVSGWTKYSGNIYRANVDATISQVFVNGAKQKSARYPNSGYLKITSAGSSSFSSSQLENKGSNYYQGSVCVSRTGDWWLSTNKVTGSSGQTLTLNAQPGYGLDVGEGFFLMNKLDFLDQAGEWYYDPSQNFLYLWVNSGNTPENYEVRAASIDNIISLDSKNNISIKDLNIQHCNQTAIYLNNSSYITIDNCNISGAAKNLIRADSNASNHITISNCNLSGTTDFAVYLRGRYHSVTGNSISDIGLFNNIDVSGFSGQAGTGIMNEYGGNSTISYNKITNVGNNGIHFFYCPNTIVEYNYINGACLTIDDGGGIYCYESSSGEDSDNSVIRYNIIDNVQGTNEGDTKKDLFGNGIYLDDRITNVTVSNNTVYNVSNYGLYSHNNKYCVFENNTVMDAKSGIRVTELFNATGNIVKNNIFLNSQNTGTASVLAMLKSTYSNIVKFDSNNYTDHHRTKPFSNAYNYSYNSFSEWKSITSQDGTSTFNGTSLNSGETEQLFYNNTKQSKTMNLGNTGYRDIDGKPVSGTLTLKPFTSVILIKTTSENSSTNQNPVIQEQIFEINDELQANDVVGQVTASDPDQEQTISYSLTGGNQEDLFTIQPATGEILSKTDITAPQQDKSVDLVVTVTDNATSPLSASAKVTISIIAPTDIPDEKPSDSTAPVITSFSIPETISSLEVPVLTFSATDNVGIAGYLITETTDSPDASDVNWSTNAPESYTLASSGTYKLYAWTKDVQGNVSKSTVKTVTVSFNEDPFAEYLFEETSGITVFDSQGDNNGTIINNEVRNEGIIGSGLQLDGKNYVKLGQCFDTNIKDQLTLSAWLKPDASPEGYQGIIIHGGNNIDSYGLYINPDSYTIGFKTSGTSSAWNTITNVKKLWDGQWHNLTVTYNGSEKVIYLDAEILSKVNASGNIESGIGYNLLIGAGRDTDPPSLLYKGSIDEVRICNYALPADKVSEIFNMAGKTLETVYSSETVEICQGDNYFGWTETGVYERTLTSDSGADSIVTTTLTVNPTYEITEEVTIFEGEKYLEWAEEGEYKRVLTSSTGCDSTVITALTVQKALSPSSEYLFEETSGITVFDSQGDNNGTIINNDIRNKGVIGSGLQLDGKNFVKLGQCFDENIKDQLTLSAWLKPDASSNEYQGIIMHGGKNIDSYALYINSDSYTIGFKTSGTSSAWNTITNVKKLWDGQWHNLTVTYNGSEKVIYLDAEILSKVNASGNIESGIGYNLLIGAGRDTNPPSLLYKGSIDEVRICNYALSADKVSEIFNMVEKTLETVYSAETVEICQGDNYFGWTETGVYERTLTSDSGADSIVTTTLTVNPTYEITEEVTILEGEKYLEWSKEGEYRRVLTSSTGCDSTVITILSVQKAYFISEYLFEETGTTVYDSEDNNDGTILNGEFRNEGVAGSGLQLDGKNYVNLGQCFDANIKDQLTLSAWLKPDASSNGYQGIIMHGGKNIDSYALYINPDSYTIGFKTSGTSSAWNTIDNVKKLWDGQWHNITVTYNGSEKVIYLDAEILSKVNASGNIESGIGYNLLIGAGRDTNPPSLLYKGSIDEVRVCNYALSPEEVSEVFSMVKLPNESTKLNTAKSNLTTNVNAIEFNILESQGEFTVYPNPASSFVTIDYPNLPNLGTKVQILNSNGQVVYDAIVEAMTTKIDLNNMKSGMYLIRSITNNQASVKKLIIN